MYLSSRGTLTRCPRPVARRAPYASKSVESLSGGATTVVRARWGRKGNGENDGNSRSLVGPKTASVGPPSAGVPDDNVEANGEGQGAGPERSNFEKIQEAKRRPCAGRPPNWILKRAKVTGVVDVEILLSARWRALPRRHCSVSHYAERRHG